MVKNLAKKPASMPLSERHSWRPEDSSFWESLPSSPGIYLFEDAKGTPLYIGKSINLRVRIKQHYEGYITGSTKAFHFIPKTKTIYLKQVNNDIEAIILEANYIKQYRPRYNSVIKDDRSNVYIIITNTPNSKIKIIHATDVRELELDDYQKQVFGPYTSVKVADLLVKQLRSIFGVCQQPFNARQKACFNFHLGKCPGACIGIITVSQYSKHLGQIRKFLNGHFRTLEKSLINQINKLAKKEDFETAQILKYRLQSLKQTIESQSSSMLLMLSDANEALLPEIVKKLDHPKLKRPPYRIECYDLAHLQGRDYVGAMSVFEKCTPVVSEYRHFHVDLDTASDPHAMKQIISRRLNHPEWRKPDLIILDGGIPQLSIVSSAIPSEIPVVALAKKKETIYFYSKESKIVSLTLAIDDPVLNLFRSIRDEAHRFGNTFHKKTASKNFIQRN